MLLLITQQFCKHEPPRWLSGKELAASTLLFVGCLYMASFD